MCNCTSGNLEIPGSLASRTPRNDGYTLTPTGCGLIAARMINVATISFARRRRILAVWAVVCV
jgi:hypothetical protein